MSILSNKLNPSKSDLLYAFTNGIKPDAELFSQEIKVQKAWAKGLFEIKFITEQEYQLITDSLTLAFDQMSSSTFEWKEEDEDIHMNIERFVNEKTNGLGKKMHMGRSRNDLIATTLRLHVSDSATEISQILNNLILSLTELAKKYSPIIIPGMTHQQHGQPVRFSHVLLGHAWAIKRDQKRIEQVQKNALRFMPLGSAALAGTTIPIDIEKMSQELGFSSPSYNSYDAVGDRDALIECTQACALFGAHLSRLAEDIIFWSSSSVGLIKLPEQWSTGSSIMPNKRNPDVAELAKGKASLWIGDATGILTLLKGLATSYGSDLHESKIAYLRVVNDVKLTATIFSYLVEGLCPQEKKAKELLNHGHLLATEIADYLAQNGVAFREAYGIVAELVKYAEDNETQVHELPHAVTQKFHPLIDQIFLDTLNFENAVEKRNFVGGTSIEQIKNQITILERPLHQ